MSYREYLATPVWRERRERILLRDGGACRVCNATRNLNVHHRTYERCGHECDSDLTTLCQSCHEIFHRTGKLAKAPADIAVYTGSSYSEIRAYWIKAGLLKKKPRFA